ncbi:8-oxo-dGTP diphosphatase [Cerasibacillus quisquiliarum]|uniref:Nucleoside triphosphatase YtkD n=1 Tax=Cerasibacillus quisquiliarum TaxID=227865 RepID=A0A511V0G6_9BACI|nr:nucleoside triphosphatase YtkD [Cerasibacillus quisquiliarum]MBB5147546.1 8-oxo-dGTP diphosphatase [Cerasibacillus quisquiliarum]GEN32407.1 nucleoside triphosphatase YtkD [Cerasibacillus quisquiliarum]
MYIFTDYYNNQVRFSFQNHPFSKYPKHVWVICNYKNKWLLTNHKERGLEFPGGKVEHGETAEEAAIREVKEETGGVVETIDYIGQYHVNGKASTVIKNVYFAEIKKLEEQSTYYETYGPILLKEIPDNVKEQETYSFIMKDDVLTYCMKKIIETKL